MTRLLDKLTADLDKPCMLPHRENSELDNGLAVSELSLSDHEAGFLTDAERDAALTQLKTYGSDPKDADPLFTSKVCTLSTQGCSWPPASRSSKHKIGRAHV